MNNLNEIEYLNINTNIEERIQQMKKDAPELKKEIEEFEKKNEEMNNVKSAIVKDITKIKKKPGRKPKNG